MVHYGARLPAGSHEVLEVRAGRGEERRCSGRNRHDARAPHLEHLHVCRNAVQLAIPRLQQVKGRVRAAGQASCAQVSAAGWLVEDSSSDCLPLQPSAAAASTTLTFW